MRMVLTRFHSISWRPDFENEVRMSKSFFSNDEIGYSSEFGLICELLRKETRKQTDLFMLLMNVWDTQFRLAAAAAKCHPSLNVDLDDGTTWLISVDIPIASSDLGGEIRLKYPDRSGRSYSAGNTKQKDSNSVAFEANNDSIAKLLDCIEDWQRWDAVQISVTKNHSQLVTQISSDNETRPINKSQVCPYEKTKAELTNQQYELFVFLASRTHATSYETLLNEFWEKEIQNSSVKTAIERLAKDLNETTPQHFEVKNEYRIGRVTIVPLSDAAKEWKKQRDK